MIFDDAMMLSGEVLADESAAVEDFADGRASSPNAASALTEINASAIGLVAQDLHAVDPLSIVRTRIVCFGKGHDLVPATSRACATWDIDGGCGGILFAVGHGYARE